MLVYLRTQKDFAKIEPTIAPQEKVTYIDISPLYCRQYKKC